MTRFEIGQSFDIGTREAAVAVRRLVAEGLLAGPRGQYVNEYGPQQQRRRVKQLRERASNLRLEALELMGIAPGDRAADGEPPTATTTCNPSPDYGGHGRGRVRACP
ncbi:hypothetical protein [Streptomyces sp. NPDC057199]|uniref:hypothetical protein n=1 Tax=Streptomyces sp. NPDC057199 TaxID=3346047 RepID=UPI00363D3674